MKVVSTGNLGAGKHTRDPENLTSFQPAAPFSDKESKSYSILTSRLRAAIERQPCAAKALASPGLGMVGSLGFDASGPNDLDSWSESVAKYWPEVRLPKSWRPGQPPKSPGTPISTIFGL